MFGLGSLHCENYRRKQRKIQVRSEIRVLLAPRRPKPERPIRPRGKHSASGNSRNTYSVVKHHGRQTPTRCADGHADSRLDSGTKPGGPDHKLLRTLRKLSGPIPASLIKSSSLQFATGSRLPSFITAAASTKLTADIRRTVAFSIATAHRSASGSSRRIAMADVSMINEEGRPLHKEDRLGRLIGRVAANAQRSPSRVRGADPTACPFRHGDSIKAFGNRAGDSFGHRLVVNEARCLTRRCVSSFFQVQTHVYRSTAITKSSTRPTASY